MIAYACGDYIPANAGFHTNPSDWIKNGTVFDCPVFFGPPWGSRTLDPQNRNLILYPTELKADIGQRRIRFFSAYCCKFLYSPYFIFLSRKIFVRQRKGLSPLSKVPITVLRRPFRHLQAVFHKFLSLLFRRRRLSAELSK